jgi:hypothetical protein
MKKIFLAMILLISLILSGCVSHVTMKNGYPTSETLQKEFAGQHDFKTSITPGYGAKSIDGFAKNKTVNELMDILVPGIIAASNADVNADVSANARIIYPDSKFESHDDISMTLFYRNDNAVGIRFVFVCDRPAEDETSFPGDQRLTEFAYIEYDAQTNKAIKDNVSSDEVSDKRALFVDRQLKSGKQKSGL